MNRKKAVKFCECGCGRPTRIATKTRSALGHVRGQPVRFIHGHHPLGYNIRGRNPNWKGGVKYEKEGRKTVLVEGRGYVRNSRLVVERVIGRKLSDTNTVHHVNRNCADDRPKNLVACEDQSYHDLLHRRSRAYYACGHSNWRWCYLCRKWDAPENLYIGKKDSYGATKVFHSSCFSRYNARRYREKVKIEQEWPENRKEGKDKEKKEEKKESEEEKEE